jgi:hypothetical protein
MWLSDCLTPTHIQYQEDRTPREGLHLSSSTEYLSERMLPAPAIARRSTNHATITRSQARTAESWQMMPFEGKGFIMELYLKRRTLGSNSWLFDHECDKK